MERKYSLKNKYHFKKKKCLELTICSVNCCFKWQALEKDDLNEESTWHPD